MDKIPADDLVSFADALVQARVAAELTQEELAARAGLSARGISDLERGLHTRPRPYTALQLATALGLEGRDRANFLAAARARRTDRSVSHGETPIRQDRDQVRVREPTLASQPLTADGAESADFLAKLRVLLEAEGISPDLLENRLLDEQPFTVAAASSRDLADRLRAVIDHLVPQAPESDSARILARLWAHRALALAGLGLSEDALADIESGRLVVSDLDSPLEDILLLIVEAVVIGGHGRPHLALTAAEKAERLARQQRQPALVAWSTSVQAHAYQQLGQINRAMTLARQSAALYESIGARDGASRVRGIVALGVWYAGRYREAEELQRRNLQEARRRGDRVREAYMLCGLGSSLRAQGSLDEAEGHLNDALDLAAQSEDHHLYISIEYHLANLWADRGDGLLDDRAAEIARSRSEAISRFEHVLDLARHSRDSYMSLFSTIDLAVNLAHWGDLSAAQALLDSGSAFLTEIGESMAPRAWSLLSASEVALAECDWSRAIQAEEAIPLLQEASPGGLAQAHRVVAIASGAMRDSETARLHWVASLGAAKRHGQRLEELRTARAMGACRTSDVADRP